MKEHRGLGRVRVRIRVRVRVSGLPGRVSMLGLPGWGGLSWVAWARSKSRR